VHTSVFKKPRKYELDGLPEHNIDINTAVYHQLVVLGTTAIPSMGTGDQRAYPAGKFTEV
jgi:hypothetical protein